MSSTTSPISVVVADDHALVRETIVHWLNHEPDMRVLKSVGSADEAIAAVHANNPDILLLDIDMPGRYCFDAAREVRQRCPRTRIVFCSAYINDTYIEEALELEASGYVTKGESPQSIVQAIRVAANGSVYFSPEVQTRIVIDAEGLRLAQPKETRLSSLSSRETEVLRYLSLGLAKKEIAQRMHISVKTVGRHTSNLMDKLAIHDRVELARFAIREGLIQP